MASTGRMMIAAGHATALLLALFYVACVVFDLMFPGWAMHAAWAPLIPGFEWLSLGSFVLGLAVVYVYGWLIALVWVPLYRFFLGPAQ